VRAQSYDRLIGQPEAAETGFMSVRTFQRLRREGKAPAPIHMDGRRRLVFKFSEILQWASGQMPQSKETD
jgi:predicted DNA-binding transcriptional regulator AlpA